MKLMHGRINPLDLSMVADKVFCIVFRATTLSLRYHYLLFAMSSDDASSTVTYTSVSSGSSEPSAWGILLVNAGEIPNVDPSTN
ncbi:hypothetical protein Tco_0990402 [Tanacetum coccineum]|uniref:Uncharacterized protein n=1 Tax=Tanacetum coccineum TaxID=301880 RepID=A0ABQ5EWD5_9ASTR